MIPAVWLFTIFLNLLFAFGRKKNKTVLFLSVVLIVLLLGGNNMNADYPGYLRYYNSQVYPSTMEVGYTFLSSLFHAAGIEYQFFVVFIMALSVILMVSACSYYDANTHLFLVLYLVTMFFLDAVQIRQFLAYVLFAFSLIVLSQEKKKALSALIMILAALFQWTALFFLPIIFLDSSRRMKKRTLKLMIAVILFSCAIIFLNGNSISFLMPLIRKFVTGQKLLYFETKTHFGFILYFLFQFSCLYIAYICRETLQSMKGEGKGGKKLAFANNVFMATVYASFGMPLVMINNNFSRLFKYTMIPCFILLSLLMDRLRMTGETIKLTKKVRGSFPTFAFVIGVYIVVYEMVIQVGSVVGDVLTNNIFF